MLATRLLLPALLLGLATPGRAQTTAPAATPRYYVGLGLYSSGYQPLGGTYYRGVRVPVQLTLGYQWRPRLAVQLGIAYSANSTNYFGLGKYYTGSGAAASPYAYFSDNGTNGWRNTSVALLGRYTLTRQPGHRFQADVLGGLTLEHQRDFYTNTHTDSDSTQTTHVTTNSDGNSQYLGLLVTAGLSTRYRFGRHLEAVLDVTLNQSTFTTASVTHPTSATALGLRYRFGYW